MPVTLMSGKLHAPGCPAPPRSAARQHRRQQQQCQAATEAPAAPQEQDKEHEALPKSSLAPHKLPPALLAVECIKYEDLGEDIGWKYKRQSNAAKQWTRFKLLRALPWRRFKKGSVLTIDLGGAIPEAKQAGFGGGLSVPALTEAFQKAALDPRIIGVYINISPLDVGWAKLVEITRYIRAFRESGKFCWAYMELGGEKEYFLACACSKIIIPPSAAFSLKGFSVQGQFLRGVLDKVGVEPQVQRIGVFKSAGDQLLRTDMAPEQRQQLQALLDSVFGGFVTAVAEARGKSQDEVVAMLDQAYFNAEEYQEGGWVDELKYEWELYAELQKLQKVKEDEDLKQVKLERYAKVKASTFGLKKGQRIAVIRAEGAITGSASGPLGIGGNSIDTGKVLKQLKKVERDKDIKALILRISSPGGDALASDIMWHAIRQVAAKKPVVASMGDVAASGGYYMAMGCHAIVAEALTITGSIGIVAATFNLAKAYERIGFTKEVISKGRYAELLSDQRSFSEDELALFQRSARASYEDFRNKAALSRRLPEPDLESKAQGRVWPGALALEQKLVDVLGGLSQAVKVARQMADLGDEPVQLVEISKGELPPLQQLLSVATSLQLLSPSVKAALSMLCNQSAMPSLLSGSFSTSAQQQLLMAMAQGQITSPSALHAALGVPSSRPLALAPDYQVEGAGLR